MAELKIVMIGDTHFPERGGYDGSDLAIPDADLIFGMGDWVRAGTDGEYEAAVQWAKSFRNQLIPVRGNHDNGRWHHHALQVCPSTVTTQLKAHSPIERMGIVEWKPLIWESVVSPILNLQKKTEWYRLDAQVQDHIVKLKDLTPGYYAFDAGDMRFICLDTSNWLLGEEQVCWLKAEVRSATKPVVLVGHHHFLPVGIVYDSAQVHERDFLRQLILQSKNIIAYLHGHAHFDRWWKYGHADILAVRHRACRTVTFRDGEVVGSVLDGELDSPEPFVPKYMSAQCMNPGQVACLTDSRFQNPWQHPKTECLGWLPTENEPVELVWSMRLPQDLSSVPHHLSFQIRSGGRCFMQVDAPGLDRPLQKDIPPSPDGRTIAVEIGPLAAGFTKAKLQCSDGWGYVTVAAGLTPAT